MKSKRFVEVVAVVCVGLLIPSYGLAEIDAVAAARHDLQLGFTVGGKVVNVPVKPGDHVKKGQLLMQMEDDEGQALVDLYRLRVDSDLELLSTQQQLELAKIEHQSLQQAFENKAASQIEVDRARVRTNLAELEVQMARQRADETRFQLQQAEARHARYSLLAPETGVVDQVVIAEGETIDELKPVIRLVVTDPLWVDAAVPTAESLDLKPDTAAWVRSTLPGRDTPVRGKVIHIASVADAASDTRLVRVEIPNELELPAGCRVLVSFTAPPDASATAPVPDAPHSLTAGMVTPPASAKNRSANTNRGDAPVASSSVESQVEEF